MGDICGKYFSGCRINPPPHTNAGGEMLRKVHFSDSGNGEWRRRRPTQTIHSQLSGFHFYNFLQQIWIGHEDPEISLGINFKKRATQNVERTSSKKLKTPNR